MGYSLVLFGEAEKGEMQAFTPCHNVDELLEKLGHPPPNTLGIYYAIQALLYSRQLLFFRVREEGFSAEDYLKGLWLLQEEELGRQLQAVCMPGVANEEILREVWPFCKQRGTALVVSESDLYDYLTQSSLPELS